jgi:hypothetical protein
LDASIVQLQGSTLEAAKSADVKFRSTSALQRCGERRGRAVYKLACCAVSPPDKVALAAALHADCRGGLLVVFHNSTLGFVEIEQKSSGFLDTGTNFKNPNFAAMAEAVGVRGIRLETPSEVDKGIAEALAHDGPVLVDAVVSRMVLPIPPSITVEMAKGFSVYMLKAIIGGRGDDLVDLARTNLWQ